MQTPDAVQTFREIEAIAKRTREGIGSGEIPKGSAALYKIEKQAGDAHKRMMAFARETPGT